MQGFIIWLTGIFVFIYIVAGIVYVLEKKEGYDK